MPPGKSSGAGLKYPEQKSRCPKPGEYITMAFRTNFPHRHSVLSRWLRDCLCFRYGCVRSLGYCLSRKVRIAPSWRFEFINTMRSTKKRDIGCLGQLVVSECLYLFFAYVRQDMFINSNQITHSLNSTPTASYSQTAEAQPYALGKRSKPGKPPWKAAEPVGKIGARNLNTPFPSKPAS